MGKVGGLIFIQIDHPKWEAQRYNRYDTVLYDVESRQKRRQTGRATGRVLVYSRTNSLPPNAKRVPHRYMCGKGTSIIAGVG